jgi:CRP/FNR family transcriptional regulator, cyclic AMP receptor protein
MRALLAQKENQMVAGVGYQFDEVDRCIKILESFSLDDTSLGTLLQHVVKVSQEEFSASYLETDILMTAPRLLKTAEQLGFIPVAYLPAFFHQVHFNIDVVKMVKLNMVYSREETPLSEEAAEIAGIIDNNFQDQKLGIAIINLLRALPIFEGLGDGELQKIARLFTQKLYRPGEAIFKQGDSSNEAYVLMRGQIDICLESSAEPIATITNGQIFGEVAFLDGSSRTANAVARVPSIVLVVRRSAFYELVQREPHLGMVVVRNMAMDLSNKLRRTNTTFFRKPTS